jgi:murein DD-endopeptidase MepM/ murein hydrolase activator NlpD
MGFKIKIQNIMRKLKSYFLNHDIRHWVGILGLLAVSVAGVQYDYELDSTLLQTSTFQEHEAFDGTVYPVQFARDVVNMNSNEYNSTCDNVDSDLLVPVDWYDPDDLTFPTEDLVWGNSTHDQIRINKTFYSVTHTGNYQWDDTAEGAGSHNGMDLVTCEGMEVHAIANGVVYEAGSSGSWGYYVVIKHNDVPDPDNPGRTTDLYSTYNHLRSAPFVGEGDEVKKDEVIGEVGETGTATTPHLHFSVDKTNAPFVPYWAFTSADAANAGYSFWGAVDAGVGQSNLYTYTYHPMDFIQDNLNWSGVTSYESSSNNSSNSNDEDTDETQNTSVSSSETEVVVNEIVEEVTEDAVALVDFDSIELDSPGSLLSDSSEPLRVYLVNEYGETITDSEFDGNITLEVSDESLATVSKPYLNQNDFKDGEAEFTLYANNEGKVYIYFEIAGVRYSSGAIYIYDEYQSFDKIGIETDGSFTPNQVEFVQIQIQDERGNPTPAFYGNGTVELSIIEGEGSLSETEFKKEDFQDDGIAQVELIGEAGSPITLQVTYGNREDTDTLDETIFTDFDEDDDYWDDIYYLYRKGTISGYPDGTLKPYNASTRIETLKIILDGLDQEILNVTVKYSDTDMSQWYGGVLATASHLNIVSGYPDLSFRPSNVMNRAEFMKTLFTSIAANENVDISVDPVVLKDPYADVNNLSWYAPYVQFSKEYNLFPVDGNYFEPGKEITRLEVSTAIYRLIAIVQNMEETGELEAYTTFMEPSL